MTQWLSNPIVKGAISGLVSAALVDWHAMSKFTSWTDFQAYNWSVASWRWVMGMAGGAVTAAGLGAILG
jgi:hypothetical protein